MSCPNCAAMRRLVLALQSRALRAESVLADAATSLSAADREIDGTAKAQGSDDETIERTLDEIGGCHAIH